MSSWFTQGRAKWMTYYVMDSSAVERQPPESHQVCVQISAKDTTEWRSFRGNEMSFLSGLDATCPDTFESSHLLTGSHEACSAAATAEVNKNQQYNDIISGVAFMPVAIETSLVWGRQVLYLVKEIGRWFEAVTHEQRSRRRPMPTHLDSGHRRNAFWILDTFKSCRHLIGSSVDNSRQWRSPNVDC